MKDEYDFSGAERGRFYRPGAELAPPVHLAPTCWAIAWNAPARAVPR